MPEKVKWYTSWTDAVADAKRTRRPILIDFYADWCTYCKKMDRETIPNPVVQATLSKVVCVRLNTEREGRMLASKSGVGTLPTFLLTNANGQPEGRIEGFTDASQFSATVGSLVSEFGTADKRVTAAISAGRVTPATTNLLKDLLTKRQLGAAAKLITGVDKGKQPMFPVEAYFTLGQLFLQQQSGENARRFLDRGLLLNSSGQQRGAGLFIKALTYYQEKDFKAAILALQRVIDNPGTEPGLISNARAGIADMKTKIK
jgi:thiol:disulfide interchange protein DsbD